MLEIGDVVDIVEPGSNYPGERNGFSREFKSSGLLRYFKGIALLGNVDQDYIVETGIWRIIAESKDRHRKAFLIRNETLKLDLIIGQEGLRLKSAYVDFFKEKEFMI